MLVGDTYGVYFVPDQQRQLVMAAEAPSAGSAQGQKCYFYVVSVALQQHWWQHTMLWPPTCQQQAVVSEVCLQHGEEPFGSAGME